MAAHERPVFPYAYGVEVKQRISWWLADEADRLSDAGKLQASAEVDRLAHLLLTSPTLRVVRT